MSLRITTNMVRRNYQSNLNNSLSGLEKSRRQAETGRRFAHSYEDPSAAHRGKVLENRFARNNDYLNAAQNTQKWQDTQEDVVNQLSGLANTVGSDYGLQAMNGTNAEQRDTFAETLRAMQKSMVYTLNTKYGGSFAMGGTDGKTPPFELQNDGTVTYRGLDVNDPANAAALEELSRESAYVDLGFGLTFANGEVVSSSAFDSALPGIKVVGFGQDDNGTNKNLISLVGEMADVLDAEDFDEAEYEKLFTAFQKGTEGMRNCLTELGTKTKLLTDTCNRLENEELNITTQYDGEVNINQAEALMNFSYSQYVYNVALKIGTNILTPSLLDFMK